MRGEAMNKLMFGLPYYFGIKKAYRDHKILEKFVHEKILEIYKRRYNAAKNTETKHTNIIDIMIDHNKECIKNDRKEDLISDTFIVENAIAFMFAGIDTTLQTSTSGLMWMAQGHQEWFEKIRSEGLSTFAEYEKNRSLDFCIKEM